MPGELNDIRVTSMMMQGRNCIALLIIKIHPSTNTFTERMRDWLLQLSEEKAKRTRSSFYSRIYKIFRKGKACLKTYGEQLWVRGLLCSYETDSPNLWPKLIVKNKIKR